MKFGPHMERVIKIKQSATLFTITKQKWSKWPAQDQEKTKSDYMQFF